MLGRRSAKESRWPFCRAEAKCAGAPHTSRPSYFYAESENTGFIMHDNQRPCQRLPLSALELAATRRDSSFAFALWSQRPLTSAVVGAAAKRESKCEVQVAQHLQLHHICHLHRFRTCAAAGPTPRDAAYTPSLWSPSCSLEPLIARPFRASETIGEAMLLLKYPRAKPPPPGSCLRRLARET